MAIDRTIGELNLHGTDSLSTPTITTSEYYPVCLDTDLYSMGATTWSPEILQDTASSLQSLHVMIQIPIGECTRVGCNSQYILFIHFFFLKAHCPYNFNSALKK
jgi:hypothetical protein